MKINYQSEKTESLFKLIAIEPETLDNLTRVTGWGRTTTQQTLLQLVADCRITFKNMNGGQYYMVKHH